MRSGDGGPAFPRMSPSPPSPTSAARCRAPPPRRGRPVAAGVPCAGVAADSVYGGDYALRLWLERQPIGYVLAVTSKQRAPSGFDSVHIRTRACFGADDWRRLSAGEGAKGPRLYDWAYKD